ncbi:MAG: LytTR family DNA-binding domain-containing protein [Flavobacteriales bacterium]|uniref:LytR/AlgR family response regulator transcription factor n=1 Tax=Sanyastnella coralliicola TaxID=3069118 RepID=UPI0027B94A6D|nr:LytTR family DNA-binding domain-containing protein [Longitalea sp. SCSIO 12813]MCH2198561.1 LytTR family DNA-binding domain-containing protein [Flavobacteriales bacterium]
MSKHITALIVEDSRLARLELKSMLEEHDHVELIGEADNVDDALQILSEQDPDVLFLDIHMPGKDGFQLLEELEVVPHVIFTTAYDEYAIKSFEYNAFDYLLKPLKPERLGKAIEKVTQAIADEEQREVKRQEASGDHLDIEKRVFVKDGDKCWLVRLGDIRMFEVYGNYSRVYFENYKPLILRSLNQLEERLDPEVFFRANRQQIINVNSVDKVDSWFNGRLKVTMQGGAEVEISRRQAVRFKEMLSL